MNYNLAVLRIEQEKEKLSPEAQEAIQFLLGLEPEEIAYYAIGELDNVLNAWIEHPEEDNTLFDSETNAYVEAYKLLGETLEWPKGYEDYVRGMEE